MSSRQAARQVLLVDDNDEVRLTITRSLELENFVVQTAEHGLAALELLEGFTPDIILSDINMPRMDGIEFYHKIQENPRWMDIPLLFLTANDSLHNLVADNELEFEDFLIKPVSVVDLLAAIQKRLRRSKTKDKRPV